MDAVIRLFGFLEARLAEGGLEARAGGLPLAEAGEELAFEAVEERLEARQAASRGGDIGEQTPGIFAVQQPDLQQPVEMEVLVRRVTTAGASPARQAKKARSARICCAG